MSDLFDDLRIHGTVDSSGHFTIDPRKARQTMQRYQLEDPHAWILILLACAVSAGATRFDVSWDLLHCSIEFDGRPFTPDELSNLYSHLLVESATPVEPCVRHLAMALNAAMSLKPREVVLRSGGHRLTTTATDDVVGQDQRSIECTRLEIRFGWLRLSRQEQRLLERRGNAAPFSLTFNRAHFYEALTLPECLGLIQLQPTTCGPRERLLMNTHGANPVVNLSRSSPLPLSAFVWIDFKPINSIPLTVVVDGISYESQTIILCSGIHAVVAGPSFTPDLSYQSLVEDDAWKQMVELLKATARDLVIEIGKELPRREPRFHLAASNLVGNLMKASVPLELLAHFTSLKTDRDYDIPERLGRRILKGGHEEAGRTVLEGLLSTLEELGDTSLYASNYKKAAAFYETALNILRPGLVNLQGPGAGREVRRERWLQCRLALATSHVKLQRAPQYLQNARELLGSNPLDDPKVERVLVLLIEDSIAHGAAPEAAVLLKRYVNACAVSEASRLELESRFSRRIAAANERAQAVRRQKEASQALETYGDVLDALASVGDSFGD